MGKDVRLTTFMRSQTCCVALALLLGCCVPIRVVPVGRAGPGEREIVADGPFVHSPSGAVFPSTLGGCPRGAITAYSGGQDDVGTTYLSVRPGVRLLTTVYVYPRSLRPPSDLQGHIDEVIREIEEYHSDAKVGETRQFTIDSSKSPLSGLVVSFEYSTRLGFQNEMVTSFAYLFVRGDWFVKFRMTCPQSEVSGVHGLIDQCLRDFGWPEPNTTQQPTGAPSGAGG